MAGTFNSSILDAPDTAVRRILMKREAGQPLNSSEQRRLAERMNAEQETQRAGGTVKQSIVPRRLSPFEEGERQRQADDDFSAGYEGRQKPGTQAPAPGMPPTAPTGMPASEATTAMRSQGPVNVGAYKGSMWAPQGSYAAARPITDSMAVREQASDSVLRKRFGAPPNDQDGMAPAAPNRENVADAALRRRFGPPPNERSVVDVASETPVRRAPMVPPPTRAPAPATAPEPSTGGVIASTGPAGNVRRLSPQEIEAARRKGKQTPIRLPEL